MRLNGHIKTRMFAALLLTVSLTATGARCLAETVDTNALMEMSLEELMDMKIVTSVAGKSESWFDTPSAIYVITADDIRRAGHRSIAEALRMVPGAQVLQETSSHYALTIRGFNGPYVNKLLVLIDGRTVFDPAFSGTFWDITDVVLEDIDRIEVIRGPGATLWGANAVNGVVNIITKNSKDTQGTYMTGGMGNYERGFATIRHGLQINENTWGRVYGKYTNRNELPDRDGHGQHDDWDLAQGGFRLDSLLEENTQFTFQGDAYHSDDIGSYVKVPLLSAPGTYDNRTHNDRATGGNLLFRYEKNPDQDNGWSLQGYYERVSRSLLEGLNLNRDTYDLDFRHRFTMGDGHKMIWGLNWRMHNDYYNAGEYISYDPASRTTNLYSGFVQDTMTLVEDTLFFMLGTKLEDNDYTGFEWQPSGRIWWTPNDKQMLWAAYSRPVRTPARTEDDIRLVYLYAPSPITIDGQTGTDAEKVDAYEAGYRHKWTDTLTSDTAVFYNKYRGLLTFPATTPPLSLTYGNRADGQTSGIEQILIWQIRDNWRFEGSYTFMNGGTDPGNEVVDIEVRESQHMFSFRSYLDITSDVEWNVAGYWYGKQADEPNRGVENNLRLDTGITWRVDDRVEVAIVGHNLLDSKRYEYADPLFEPNITQVPRSFYVQVTYRF